MRNCWRPAPGRGWGRPGSGLDQLCGQHSVGHGGKIRLHRERCRFLGSPAVQPIFTRARSKRVPYVQKEPTDRCIKSQDSEAFRYRYDCNCMHFVSQTLATNARYHPSGKLTPTRGLCRKKIKERYRSWKFWPRIRYQTARVCQLLKIKTRDPVHPGATTRRNFFRCHTQQTLKQGRKTFAAFPESDHLNTTQQRMT